MWKSNQHWTYNKFNVFCSRPYCKAIVGSPSSWIAGPNNILSFLCVFPRSLTIRRAPCIPCLKLSFSDAWGPIWIEIMLCGEKGLKPYSPLFPWTKMVLRGAILRITQLLKGCTSMFPLGKIAFLGLFQVEKIVPWKGLQDCSPCRVWSWSKLALVCLQVEFQVCILHCMPNSQNPGRIQGKCNMQ